MEQLGALAGLAAAACWAVASVFYVRVPIGAGAMTTFKNTLAMLLMFIALLVWKAVRGEPVFQASHTAMWDIAISGVIGLWVADVAYFRSIQILGPRRGLTLTLLTPPATAMLGQLWLSEYLSPAMWLFVLLTLFGIATVMRERADKRPEQEIRPGSTRWGVACALLGVGTMAVGAVFLRRGTQEVDSVEATFIRMFAASSIGLVASFALGELREIRGIFRNPSGLSWLCLATLLGTVLGVWLMLLSYKYCPTGMAATLTSTTPLFVIPVVWYAYGQRVSTIGIVGALVAFAGVCGLILSRQS